MELSKEDIIQWGLEYATYTELEDVSKALYSLYVQERKKKYPEEQNKAKDFKKKYKNKDALYWRYKKKGAKLDEFKQKPFIKPTTDYRK